MVNRGDEIDVEIESNFRACAEEKGKNARFDARCVESKIRLGRKKEERAEIQNINEWHW